MATLFDLCSAADADKLTAIANDIKKKEREEIDAKIKATHIFKTYEEALDYLQAHPGHSIMWHGSDVSWSAYKNRYREYYQISYDDCVFQDAVRYCSREDLLQDIEKHKERIARMYPDTANTKSWLTEFGTLAYVYLV